LKEGEPMNLRKPNLDLQTLLAQASDSITVKRVFGEPIERDGVLVIPAAMVAGGGGGGAGTGTGFGPDGAPGEGTGTGGGWGVQARPVGAFVVRDGVVTWVPAIDWARIAFIGGAVVISLIFARRSIAQTRARARIRERALDAHRRRHG
jgi:uncharacterized spore protein YtfJ